MEDCASFGSVLKECQLVKTTILKKTSLPPQYPLLMLAENNRVPLRGFLNLSTSTTIEVELPEATGRFCRGAHYGWLFTLGFDLQMNLLHPFSRQQIGLPSMLTLPDQFEYDDEFTPEMVVDMFVQKIAISASPLMENNLNDDCVIVAIYGEFSTLAFARIGEINVWTNIQVPFKGYKDVIYYKGKFYAVSWDGAVVVCDIDGNDGPKATVLDVSAPCKSWDETRKYLVESSGDLLLVYREPILFDNGSGKEEKKPHYYSISFSIWRLDECRDEGNKYAYKWTKVTTLGDRALFLGRNVSTSKASCDGIKGNCIYFTDDYDEYFYNKPDGGGWDTGIFNLEDGNIQFCYTRESLSKISPSLWYI